MEHQLTQGDCREQHKEEGEDKFTICVNGGCENQKESIDGSLNCEGLPTDGCSKLYVGDIYIMFENEFDERKSLVVVEEELELPLEDHVCRFLICLNMSLMRSNH